MIVWAVAVAPGIRDDYWTITRKWTLDDLADAWSWIHATLKSPPAPGGQPK